MPQGRSARGIDGLKGQRVTVQFASPPQSLLAARSDITSVTRWTRKRPCAALPPAKPMPPSSGAASAGYINRTALNDALHRVHAGRRAATAVPGGDRPVQQAAGLRDEIDAVLPALAAPIRELSTQVRGGVGSRHRAGGCGPAQLALADAMAAPRGGRRRTRRRRQGQGDLQRHLRPLPRPDAVVEDRKINLRRLTSIWRADGRDLFTTVTNGRPAKGMPAWKDVYSHQDFVDILGYLRTIQEK